MSALRSTLAHDHLVELLEALGAERLDLPAGDRLRLDGRWALLIAGEVRIAAGPDAHDLGLLQAGDLIDDLAALDPSSVVEAIVEQPVVAVVFAPADIARAAGENSLYSRQILEHLFELTTARMRDAMQTRTLLERRHRALIESQGELILASRELEARHRELSETQARLIEASHMAMLGRLTAGIAHDLNNPVGAMLRAADHVRRDMQALVVRLAAALSAVAGERDRQVLVDGIVQAITVSLEPDRRSTADIRAARDRLARRLESLSIPSADLPLDSLSRVADEHGFAGAIDAVPGIGGSSALAVVGSVMELAADVRSIGVCGGRIAHVVRGLRSYARLDEQTVSLVDIREGLEETLTLFGHELRNGIELVRDLADVPLISGNPAALNQVWSNLIDNAIHAMHGRGRLTISTAERRSGVAVRIADTGAGIPAEHLPKIFDLRFTTKHGKADFGLGLGLAIVQSIVRQHGGEILVDSQPGATTFEVWFPKAGV